MVSSHTYAHTLTYSHAQPLRKVRALLSGTRTLHESKSPLPFCDAAAAAPPSRPAPSPPPAPRPLPSPPAPLPKQSQVEVRAALHNINSTVTKVVTLYVYAFTPAGISLTKHVTPTKHDVTVCSVGARLDLLVIPFELFVNQYGAGYHVYLQKSSMNLRIHCFILLLLEVGFNSAMQGLSRNWNFHLGTFVLP